MLMLLERLGLDVIDGYKFVKQLGGGKASIVSLYTNQEGNNRVVKMLIAPRSEEELNKFINEPKIIEQLNQFDTKNIPRLISGLEQINELATWYYTTEYVDGQTLSEYIKNNPLPWDTKNSLRMISCIASAL